MSLYRPASLGPKPINEPARHTRGSDRRSAMLSIAACAAAIVVLLFFIMKPAPRQSVSYSTPSETTGSPPQFNQENVESRSALVESKALPASLPSDPATPRAVSAVASALFAMERKSRHDQSTCFLHATPIRAMCGSVSPDVRAVFRDARRGRRESERGRHQSTRRVLERRSTRST